MLEARRLRPLPKMHQTHDSPLGEAIPKTPLGAVDLTKTYVRLSHHSGEQTLCL
ncbi:MAG: hypothetical protein ACYCOX_14650 [Acidobacteriaceae bacterium]